MIGRIQYLKELARYTDKHVIKVVTGIRGCGKSVILELFQKVLLQKGIPENRIIFVHLDESAYAKLLDAKSLENYIVEKLQDGVMNYIFIDDAYKCSGFQKVLAALLAKGNTDIYIAGSNRTAITQDLAEYQLIPVLPFSFAEYMEAQKQSMIKAVADQTPEQHFMDFARYGNIPFTLQLFKNSRNINQYLLGLYNTIIVQDIASIHPIKEIKVLDAAMSYMLTHSGLSCSSKKLADTLTEMGFKTTQPTAENYLQFMEECGLIYRVGRYDIKERENLKSLPTFFVADMGMSNMLTKKPEMNPILRNLVFLELKRQQYDICVGKVGNNTIDFVASKGGQTFYIQVEAFVKEEKVLNRRLRPFRQIRDFYPRVLISLDKTTGTSESGIRFCNALDFLQNGQL
jgi:hypothetical protein